MNLLNVSHRYVNKRHHFLDVKLLFFPLENVMLI